jgi:hypothetical protein
MMHEPIFSLLDLLFYSTALLVGWWWLSLDANQGGNHNG